MGEFAGGVLLAADSDTAEIYDPTSDSWTFTNPMAQGRNGHTSTLLPNGKVLVAGGGDTGDGRVFATAELYDPATGTWSPTGSMADRRSGHSATLLPDGKGASRRRSQR